MQQLKILRADFINHNVKRFIVEKPKEIIYHPGQSAQLSINLPGWEEQLRPFTFTSLNHWDYLEFIVKIYDHQGVTEQMGKLNAGAELLLHDIFGTIKYKGPGIFIAGGAGITPFIAIFRALFHSNNLRNIALLHSNQTEDDLILFDELSKMLGPAYQNVFTRKGVIGFHERRIDRKFLIETIGSFDSRFYVCGPKKFTEDVCEALLSLGAKPEYLVI